MFLIGMLEFWGIDDGVVRSEKRKGYGNEDCETHGRAQGGPYGLGLQLHGRVNAGLWMDEDGRTNVMFIRVFEKFAKGALSEFLPAALGEAMVVRDVGAHCNECKWPEALPRYGVCFAAAPCYSVVLI